MGVDGNIKWREVIIYQNISFSLPSSAFRSTGLYSNYLQVGKSTNKWTKSLENRSFENQETRFGLRYIITSTKYICFKFSCAVLVCLSVVGWIGWIYKENGCCADCLSVLSKKLADCLTFLQCAIWNDYTFVWHFSTVRF